MATQKRRAGGAGPSRRNRPHRGEESEWKSQLKPKARQVTCPSPSQTRTQTQDDGGEMKAMGRSLHVPVYKPAAPPSDSQNDHRLNASEVFQKLMSQDPAKDNNLELRPLHSKCGCGDVSQKPNGTKNHHSMPSPSSSDDQSSSDSDESDDDDEEEDEMRLDDFLRLLIVHQKKGSQGIRAGKVLANLAATVSFEGDVPEIQLQQLINLTISHNASVRKASLTALTQAAQRESHAALLLQSGVVTRVLSLLHMEEENSIVAAGCHFLKEITVHKELEDYWMEEMIVTGLATLIGLLTRRRGQGPAVSQSQHAAASLLAGLAGRLQLAVMMLDHCMDDIEDTFRKHNNIREPITELLINLIRHNDHTAGGVLNYRFTSLVAVVLRDGPCSVQARAMEFCQQLCVYEAGIQALVRDTMLLTTCIQVLKASHCREVRRRGLSTLATILSTADSIQLRRFFKQIQRAFRERNSANVDPGRGRARDVWQPLSRQTVDGGDDEEEGGGGRGDEDEKKMRSGFKEIVGLVVRTIHIEGKFQLDDSGKTVSVRFRPRQDDFSTLQEATNCLKSLVTISEAVLSQMTAHRLLVSQGALCLIDVLHVYTLSCFGPASSTTPRPDKHQRNPEALYLQASMKLWEGAAKREQQQQPMPCQEYGEPELRFVKSMLEVLQVLAESSCKSWNADVVRQLEEQVLESTDWEDEEVETNVHNDGSSYKYVRTVGEAFHESTLPGKTRGEQKSKVRFAWDDESQSSSKKPTNVSENNHPRSVNLGSHSSSYLPESKNVAQRNLNNNSASSAYGQQDKKRRVKMKSKVNVDPDRLVKAQAVKRKALFTHGVCETVAAWMVCGHEHIQELACSVMQCMLQPRHPEEIHRFSTSLLNPAQRHKARAQEMADSLAERDVLLTKILSQMSLETADLMSSTLRVKGHDQVKVQEKAEHMQQNDDASSITTSSTSTSSKPRKPPTISSYKPTLKVDEPLAYQTSLAILDLCGKRLVRSLADQASPAPNTQATRTQLLLLYDMVAYGDVVIHMTLASHGLLTNLLTFIQRKVQQSVNVLLCLTILRNLVGDHRIKQLFRSEGGEKVLQKVAKATRGAVQRHAQRFLAFLAQGTTGLVWT